jgi:hypothetical protein
MKENKYNTNFILLARLFIVCCISEVKNGTKQWRFHSKRMLSGDKIPFPKTELGGGKEYDDMSATLGDKYPSLDTVKNGFARFRAGHLSTEDDERSGRPTQLTIPVFMPFIP